MGLVRIVKTNLAIIRALNSGNQATCIRLIHELITRSEKEVRSIFTKKWYIWNIIRGKDFYKLMSRYVIQQVRLYQGDPTEVSALVTGELAIHLVMATEPRDQIKREFVKAIERDIRIMTVELLPYITDERIDSILNDPIGVLMDDKCSYIAAQYADIRGQLREFERLLNQ